MTDIMPPALSRREWQAVAIALKDAGNAPCAGAPGEPRGWFARAYTILTGNEAARPLADPRLEAIRSFVCDARRTHRLPQQHVTQLERHGYNRAQIEALALLSA